MLSRKQNNNNNNSSSHQGLLELHTDLQWGSTLVTSKRKNMQKQNHNSPL